MTDAGRLAAFRAAAVAAAESTFQEFRDQPESDFYQAPGRTPEETWHEVRDRVGLVTAEATALALDDAALAPVTIRDWHRSIFETTFPEVAGRFRTGSDPMTYGYVVGPKDAPMNKTGRGTGSRSLPGRVDKICKEFNQAVVSAEASPDSPLIDATMPAARLYAKLLSAHPFDDGNGRTCYVALQFALVRLGAVTVSLPDYAEQQWNLGRALQTGGRQSYEPLARYLVEKIRSTERKGLQSD